MAFIPTVYGLFMLGWWLFTPVPAAGAAEDAQKPACTPVARAFGRDFCREDITTEAAHLEAIRAEFEQEGLDSAQALATRSRERLQEQIWELALERKFGAAALAPAPEEIAAYGADFKKYLADSHERNLATLAEIEAKKSEKYSDEAAGTAADAEAEETLRLELLEKSLRTSIAFYEERQKYDRDMPPEFHEMVREAESEIARTAIRRWKIDRALFEHYGGKVMIDQGAARPIEAYERFLSYIRATDGGALVIIDPAFAGLFEDIERMIAAGSRDSTDGAAYFSSGAWRFGTGLPPPDAENE